MLEKIVPIPPEFYDDHKDEDLITGKGTIFPFAVFLYFMQWAAFLGFVLFYWYHPSSQVTQSKLENEWDYGRHAGWNCTPMLNDPFYRARYNHDTCKELMLKPTAEDIKTLKINVDPACVPIENSTGTFPCENATAFRFMPFKGMEGLGGKRGVVQPGSLIDNTYDSTDTTGIQAELEKIFAPLKELNTCGSLGFHWKNKGGWGKSKVDKTASFDIFVDQMKKKAPAPPPPPVASPPPPSGSGGGVPSPSGGGGATGCCPPGAGSPSCTGAGGAAAAGSEVDCSIPSNCFLGIACSADPCGSCSGSGRRRLNFAMDAMMGSMGGMGDQTEVSADGAGCGSVPTNADGSCDFSSQSLPSGSFFAPGGATINLADLASYGFDTSGGAQYEPCSITKAEAVAMFEKYVTTHDPCVWAQHNAPYMCTKQGPPAPSAVFSLAYANALLAYSIFSAVCVQVFFASSKKKNKGGEETPAAGGGEEKPATAV
uniref:Uncharacterized protein n=1 Tax=Micromonas pusilla TaxID=38833 RepID=A0A7S0KW85_MICPS|mmetsp:Transcript_9581/g.37369  ORF Transcript_9581/g.37369 Transcript_9581/m.37369 type:complete len:484 (+) Transcript_9581:328-1779(+)